MKVSNMNDHTKVDVSMTDVSDPKDGVFDAIAAVALVIVFVAACILWVSSR